MTRSTGPICQRKSTRCLQVPLRSTEQIYLVFFIPTVLSCAIYIVNFSADLAVGIQHFREGNPIWGSLTIVLMYVPALVYFILTVSRPDWWMSEDEKLTGGIAVWFVLQIVQLLAFPLFALYRYAALIVLTVDATLLSGEERTKTLNLAAAPAAIELYFFLQAWFQATPQAIFQTLLFLQNNDERTYQTVVVYILCIMMSIVVLSMETASFQRFESQRINGRKLPWAMWLKKYREEELGSLEVNKPLNVEASTTGRSSVAPLIEPDEVPGEDHQTGETREVTGRVELVRQISATPPLPPKNAKMRPPPTPIRGLTSVASLPVPEMPAPPRPDSIFRDGNSETPDQNGSEATTKWRNFRVPTRKYPVKGLDEDDPVGKFVAFLWWFFFIIARIFAITIFFQFHSLILLGVLGAHYALMVAFLLYHAKYNDVTNIFIHLWLGLVYLISVIEYRVKFRNPDAWLIAYYALVILQNSAMTVVWFLDPDSSGFWYTYIFFLIFISMALCIMSAGVYNAMLKPKKRRVYTS